MVSRHSFFLLPFFSFHALHGFLAMLLIRRAWLPCYATDPPLLSFIVLPFLSSLLPPRL
nr:MAG TPA: hypothetical protein [Caudoviricetes sp.]